MEAVRRLTRLLVLLVGAARPPPFTLEPPEQTVEAAVTVETTPEPVPWRPGHWRFLVAPLGWWERTNVEADGGTFVRDLRGRALRVADLRTGDVVRLRRRGERVLEVLVIGRS